MVDTIKIKQHLKLLKFEIEHHEAIQRLTGQAFNVFEILKLSTSEVRTHSAFIAELLNPKGSHGQQDRFLKLFIDVICNYQIFSGDYDKDYLHENPEKLCALKKALQLNQNFNTVNIITEKHIGISDIENPEKESGRMDIIIQFDNFQIIIENKIHAKLGDNQLYNYCLWAEKNPPGVVFYLSLNDKESKDELNESGKFRDGGKQYELNKDYFRITYKTHIFQWLENCKKEAASLPIIRETLTQYINLINNLTNNSMSNSKIIDLIKNEPAIAHTIMSSYIDWTNYLTELRSKIFYAIIEKYMTKEEKKERYHQYIILKEISLINNEKILVCFGEDTSGIFIGYKLYLTSDAPERLKFYQKVFEELKVPDSKNNTRWIAWFNPVPEIIPTGKSLKDKNMDFEKLLPAFSDEKFGGTITAICDMEKEVTNNFTNSIKHKIFIKN